jgi:O-antigen/teichoic acid export membrane protein
MSHPHKVVRNVSTTLLTQMLSWGVTFIVTLYLPRYLGDTGLGAITLAGSFAAVLSLGVALGTSTVLTKEIARDHAEAGPLVLAALAIRLPLGIVAVVLGVLATAALHYRPDLQMLIWIALAAMAFAQISDVFGAALRGLEEIPRQNAAALAEKVVTSALTVVLVLRHAPLWTFAAVGLAGTLVAAGLCLAALRSRLKGICLPSWTSVRRLVIAGLPFLTTAVFIAVYGQSDALLLSKMSSVAAIGWYGLAKRLGGTTMMLPTALTSAMLPTLARTHHEDRAAFEVTVRRLFHLMLIIVVPFAAVLILAPGQILALLHYPPAFRHSIPVLMLMGGAVILWYLSNAAATALIACDRQAALSRITGVSALVSVPLCAGCIWLSQHFWANGAIGAMLSDVVLEAFMVVAYIQALPRGAFDRGSLAVLGRATAAALPIIGLFYFVRDKNGLLLLVPGLLLYVPLCLLLRCLPPQDIQMLQNFWRKRAHA